MGIAQIALNRPTLCPPGTVVHFFETLFFHGFLHCQNEPKSAQTKRSDPLPTPQKQEIAYVDVENKCSKPSGQALTPPPPNVQCPYENNTFQTGHMRMSRLPKILNN